MEDVDYLYLYTFAFVVDLLSCCKQRVTFIVCVLTSIVSYGGNKIKSICSVCRNQKPVLFLFMTYHRVCNKSNTTGVTSGAGTAYPSGAPEFIPFLWEFVLLNFKCLRSVLNYYRSLSFILFFFFWPLCCMSFGLRLLITPLASSNFSFYS